MCRRIVQSFPLTWQILWGGTSRDCAVLAITVCGLPGARHRGVVISQFDRYATIFVAVSYRYWYSHSELSRSIVSASGRSCHRHTSLHRLSFSIHEAVFIGWIVAGLCRIS